MQKELDRRYIGLASEGLVVRDPDAGFAKVPEEGKIVIWSKFWIRRVKEKSIIDFGKESDTKVKELYEKKRKEAALKRQEAALKRQKELEEKQKLEKEKEAEKKRLEAEKEKQKGEGEEGNNEE